MDAIDIAVTVGDALDRAGIAYFIGGSLASSLQGEPRATNDIDIVVQMAVPDVRRFVDELGKDFSVDVEALERAFRARQSWNNFYLPLFTKLDLFPCGREPFDTCEFGRRRRMDVGGGARLWVKSAEDTVVRKLLWFREGGGVSQRQWRDVVQVLRVNVDQIDDAYLDQWAGQLAIVDLLSRARQDAQNGTLPP